MYLHPLLFPGQHQYFYCILNGLVDLSLLELLNELIANKEVQLEITLVLLRQFDVLEDDWKAAWVFVHLGSELFDGPDQHVCVLTAHSEAHQ